jgi:hypothetical protein
VLSEFASTLDAVGNPTEIDRTGAITSTTTYGYDDNDLWGALTRFDAFEGRRVVRPSR